MLKHERFRQLLSRKMAGEATRAELEELARMTEENSDWQVFMEQLSLDEEENPVQDKREAEAAYTEHATRMQLSAVTKEGEGGGPGQVVKIGRGRWMVSIGVAASLLLAVSAIYLLSTKPVGATANEVTTKRGSVSRVTLPDGTQVWLNSDSKLSYLGDFTKVREVSLSGEAFFDVAKDESRPFIIHTDKINVRVLGTAFNVKSYPADEAVEATLIRGKIEVTFNDRPTEKIILKPNERLVVSSGRKAKPVMTLDNITPIRDSIVAQTAWIQNEIAFSDESLLNISHMLERRFDVAFQFTNEEVKSYAYTGIYEQESLRKILEVLSMSQKFTYSIEGRTVTIGK
ncbi:MAG TPA: FecR domain-containing protein [Puia sp.]|jgi:ferric-dicitrate binding protein FerR (iron transport regulator)